MGPSVAALIGTRANEFCARAVSGSRERLTQLVAVHHDFIWRSLRRLGVPEHSVDDAVQRVFLVAARKIDGVTAARERAFLFGVALRVASSERRARRRHPDRAGPAPAAEVADSGPIADDLVDRRRARAALDAIIEELPFDLRVVFVLYEMEEMSTHEIGALLQLRRGTVASRLRRGRELFEAAVNRYRARTHRTGAP